jgi:hypothetical protein
MESLPLFLTLVKSNSLICAFLLTGNLDAAMQEYNGESYCFSENSIIMKAFKLDTLVAFKYVQITKIEGSNPTILFVANDTIYYDNSSYYFGEKTIYYNLMDQIKEKGFILRNEKRYCYPFLSKMASISLSGKNLITLTFGENICKNF